MDVPAQAIQKREGEPSFLPSTKSISELDEAHPHWGGQTALPSPLIQMLISFRNTLTDIPEIIFSQICGHPMTQSS